MKTPSHSRYEQDKDGQWWVRLGPAGHYRGRTRCKIKTCEQCGEEYVVAPHVAKKSRYCTRACFGLARRGSGDQRGAKAGRWKGGRIKRRGYVLVYAPDHHSIQGRGTQRKYVLEHRLVMEQHLGRPLERYETVHHGPGGTEDNRLENLELWSSMHPAGQRVSDLVAFAHEVLRRYEPDAL